MDEISSVNVTELLSRAINGDQQAIQELAARATRAEEFKKQAENAEARAASAESKAKLLEYVWLMKHRCSIQHRHASL